MRGESELAPVLEPVSVSVRSPVPETTMDPTALSVNDTAELDAPEASSVAPPVPTVKSRLVLSPAPTYLRVPLSNTRLLASPVELPIELLLLPAANFTISNTAPL